MNFLNKIRSWLRGKPTISKSIIPPAEPVVVVPILERFASRPCPEYSRLNEELYCQGMTAEDGTLWIFRDHAKPGHPVVEVRVDDYTYDLRFDPLSWWNNPKDEWTWTPPQMAHNRTMHWLMRHGRDLEVHDHAYGYFILDKIEIAA